ncbi:MAG: hypothetical protein OQL20_06445 [Sedimenticola sp.]|nr:hypothetical protein [Sedimenticola sp.]
MAGHIEKHATDNEMDEFDFSVFDLEQMDDLDDEELQDYFESLGY